MYDPQSERNYCYLIYFIDIKYRLYFTDFIDLYNLRKCLSKITI